MMNKKMDRRVQKTRTLLHQALMSCILEKKYESITVQEILDRANVGRSTFYMHYSDKGELLLGGLQNVRTVLHSAQAAAAASLGKSYERIIGFSPAMFEHVYEYRRVNRALLGSNAETVVRRYIHSALASIVDEAVRTELRVRKRGNCSVSPELLTHFVVSTFISVMTFWLNTRNPVSPAEVDTAYRHLVLPALASIFGESQRVSSTFAD
jgi:AcrR family transcriptional regulator